MRTRNKLLASATALTLVAGCSAETSVPQIMDGDQATCSRSADEQYAGTVAVAGGLGADAPFKQHALDVSRTLQTNICDRAIGIGGALLKAYNTEGEGRIRHLSEPSGLFILATMDVVSGAPQEIEVRYLSDETETADGKINVARVQSMRITDSRDGGTDTTIINPVGTPNGDSWEMTASRKEGNGVNQGAYNSIATISDRPGLEAYAAETIDRLERVDALASEIIPGYEK